MRIRRSVSCVGIAVELELEISGAGILVGVGDAALAFDLVIHADGMPDRDAFQPLAACQKLRDIVIAEIARQPCIDAGDIADHAVEEIDAERYAAARPGSPCRFRPAHRPPPAAGYPLWRRPRPARDACGMQSERGLEAGLRQIKFARDQQASAATRSPSRRGVRCGRLSNHFGTSNSALAPIERALAFDLDLDPHEHLRRRVDDHGAEPERPGERDRPLEECDIAHGQTVAASEPDLNPARLG